VTGHTFRGFGTGNYDALLLKFNSTGGLVWQKTWGGRGSDSGYGVAVDPAGNIYITGATNSFLSGNYDVFLLELSSAGSLLDQEIYGGSGVNVGFGVVVGLAGSAFITGYVSEAPPYSYTSIGNDTLGTPTFSLGTLAFTLGTPNAMLGTLTGSIATPSGSETYAGRQDVFLTRYGPTTPTTYRLTLQTSTRSGSITVDSIAYMDGQSVNLTAGSHSATANPPAGYTFTGWSSSGGITVTGSPSNPTTIIITGPGTLAANYGPITDTTSTTVSCTPSTVVINEASRCTATLTDTETGPTTPTGTVTFTPGGACALAGTGSSATCSVDITPAATGTLSVSARYSGDATHQSSSGSKTVTVNIRTATTSVACTPSTIVISQVASCTATVTDTSPGTASTPTGTISFTPGGTCTLAGAGASVTCSVSIAPTAAGSLSVSASYFGDTTHGVSSSSAAVTVNTAPKTPNAPAPAGINWLLVGAIIVAILLLIAGGVFVVRRRRPNASASTKS